MYRLGTKEHGGGHGSAGLTVGLNIFKLFPNEMSL